MKDMQKLFLVLFFVLGLGLFGFLKLEEASRKFNDDFNRFYFPFKSSEWKENKEARMRMHQDLVRRKLLAGLDKTKVKELLGEPDEEGEHQLAYHIQSAPEQSAGKFFVFFQESNEIDARFQPAGLPLRKLNR